MTGFSVDKDGKQTGGLEQWATSLGKMVGSVKGLWQQLETGKKKFDAMNAAAGKSKSSFSDYIKYISESEDATEAFGIATLYTRARVLLLNMALSTGLTLAASLIVKKIAEASQSIETNAMKSKEAADAAQSTTSSLKDLVNAYEELGDKSGWGTEDFDQAKDIQAEILDLAKEQGTLDENKLGKLDLQNGKYEEQLGLLQDITAEQLEASRYELTQNKDTQGDKLVDIAKKNNRTHYLTVWSAPEMDMGDQIKNAGINVFNKFGGYGPNDLNDADSIVNYYNEVGKALKYVIDNTTEAERAAGGTYHSLYQFLLDEQSALRDDVDSYNDSTDAINNNTNARRKLQAVYFWQNDNNNSMDVSFTFDKVNSAVQTLEDTIDGFDASKLNELLWGTNEGLSDEQAQALANLRKALTDMDFSADTNGVNAFIQALVQVGIVAQSSANGVDALAAGAQKMEDISSKMDEIQSAYKASTSAMEEYNQYGYMSLDSLQSLLTMNTEYLNCLELVNGKLQINKQSYAELLAAEYAEAAATILSNAQHEVANLTADDTAESTDDLKEKTDAEKTALENLLPALKNATAATATYSAAQEFANEVEKAGERGVDPAKLEEITNRTNTQLSLLYTNMNAALKGGQALTNQLNGFGSSSKNAGKSSSTTSKSVADLSSAFDTLTKAMTEYNQYGYISADTMKSLIGVDDKFTACLTEQNGKLELNTAKFRTFVRAQLEEANAANDGGKSAGEMKKILDWLNSSVDSETISFEQLTDAIKGYGTAMDEAKEKTDAIKSAFSDLYDVGTKKKDNDFGFLDADSIEKKYQAIRNLYDKTDLFTNPAYKDALNSETGEIDYNSDAFKQMFADHLAQLATSARETGGEAGKYLAQGFEDAAAKISQNVISIREYIDGIGSSLNYATDRIDHFQSGFSDISDIVKEYNTYGGLSIDNYQKLMSLDDDYIKCLSLEEGQLKFNTKAYKDLFVAKLDAMIAEYDVADETKALAQRLRELKAAVEKSGDGFTMATDSAKNFEDTLSNIKSLLSDLIGVFEQFNTDKSNDLKIQGDAWLEVIDKRIDALNEQNDAQERAIELSKAQDALEKAKANKTVHVYHAGGSGFEWEADQNAVRDAQSTLDDTIRKNRKEDEIERLNKLKKAVQENNELIGSSFEDYEKKKKYLAEFDKMTYDDMISYNEKWKNSIIGNMKSTQVVTNINDIITKIEKLITTLETLNNVLTWITTLGKSTDGGGLTGLFSNGGLLSKVGKFFNIASEDGLGAALNQTGEWFSGKLSAALEANPNNPIIKAFSNLWTAVGEGASKFFTETSGTGLGGIIKTGIEKAGTLISGLGSSEGVLGTIATTVKTGIGSIGTALTGGSSAIPVIGPIIAVAVNNAVQQFGKISKENTKIWADQNSTTGEKIVSSIGNVLYHLSPVEGWDKSVQYAKMAAEGEGLWQKLEYGAKSLYYATGLGVMLDNIWSTIKSILKVFGVKFKEKDDGIGTSSSVSGKKGIGSWKIWFWNWGKKAKGDKKIKKSAPYNVDEEGDEIIVRKPQTGRMTYLEKGDGVIPANETENLMTIGKNPLKWLTENVGKILGSSAAKDVVEGKVDEGAVTKASQVLANSVVNTFSSAWNSVKMSTEDLIDSMNDSFQGGSTSVPTAAGTILSRVKTLFGKSSLGKLLGSFNSGVSGSIAKSAKEYSSTTELLSGTKSKTIDTMNKMRSTFESTWASVAKETGVSKDKITSISSEMFSKMETLVNQTYDAIDSNAGISSDQLNDITKSLFQSMQNIYTSGWNAIYATSTGMSQETAASLNSAYKSSSDSCIQAMDKIRNTMVGSWEQCGGGVQNLANGTYQTLSKAWADSSGSAEKMLYDTRACFDSGWGAVEQGVSNLANNPKDKLSTAWAEITSQSNATFGAEGTLKTDADNAWSNVAPGATNLANNMQWVMDQSYTAMKKGCSDAVDEINRKLNTTADSFKAVADAADDAKKKAPEPEEPTKKTGHAWYEWVFNPVGTLADTVTKYNTQDKSKNNVLQNVVHTATHPISSLVDNAKTLWKNITGHASGVKTTSKDHFANVDELGPELLVRKPQSGRYTYLETGDGVVPADITSKLFEMGGNPNKWFSEQMAKYGSQAITTKSTGNTSFSTGNIVINNPVGNSEDLASEIKKNFSTRMAQEWNKR